MIEIGGQELVFDVSHIITGINASSEAEAIAPLSQRLIDAGLVNPDFLTHVLAREVNFPTGLPTEPVGVAIPHTDPQHVRTSTLAVGVLTNPVNFGVMASSDDEVTPITVIFLLAIAPGTHHMNVLGSLIRLFRNGSFLEQVSSSSPDDIHSTIINELDKSSHNK